MKLCSVIICPSPYLIIEIGPCLSYPTQSKSIDGIIFPYPPLRYAMLVKWPSAVID